jgi:Tfp pilus assembly PilM family ATPase
MNRAVGLDLGSRFAKVVLLERTAKGIALLRFVRQQLPGGQEASELDPSWVRQLLAKAGWKAEPIGVALGASETLMRKLAVPFAQDDQLSRVVPFEVENYLPFPLEEAVIDFVPLHKDAEGTSVMVFGARKEALSEKLRVLEAAGADPYLVSVEPVALLEGLQGMGLWSEDPTLFVDLGASTTKVIYLERSKPVHMRVLQLGADLADASEQQFSDYVAKLARQLRRLRVVLSESAQRARVLLSGGNASVVLAEALSRALATEVEPLRAASSSLVRQSIPDELHGSALLALGLALPLLGVATYEVNFRKGEFRYRPKLEKLRQPLSIFLAGWTALCVVCAVAFQVRLRDVARLGNLRVQREQAVWDMVSPGTSQPKELLPWLEKELQQLQALSSAGTSGSQISALETLRAILAAVPTGVEVSVRSVDIRQVRARIEMATNSHSDAAEIVKAVNLQTPFSAVPRDLRYEAGKSVFDLEAVPKEKTSDVE